MTELDTAILEAQAKLDALQAEKTRLEDEAKAKADTELQVVRQTANAKINTLIGAAEAAIHEAQEIAEEHGLTFTWDLAYGMGGTYYSEKAAASNRWREAGWNSSSSNC